MFPFSCLRCRFAWIGPTFFFSSSCAIIGLLFCQLWSRDTWTSRTDSVGLDCQRTAVVELPSGLYCRSRRPSKFINWVAVTCKRLVTFILTVLVISRLGLSCIVGRHFLAIPLSKWSISIRASSVKMQMPVLPFTFKRPDVGHLVPFYLLLTSRFR